jgi:hypothetical protein
MAGASAYAIAEISPPDVPVPGKNSPVTNLKPVTMTQLGANLNHLFTQFKSDRQMAELRWLRNQRQYLGVYDPDIEKELQPNRSRAYPKITRTKCISVLARLMNLMFQGNDRNWTLTASSWPNMTIDDVKKAIQDAQAADQKNGGQAQQVDRAYVIAAVKKAAQKRAQCVIDLIDEQFNELGGDQTEDYVTLNRRALKSGIQYGLGVLRGPFARKTKMLQWSDHPQYPLPKQITAYKPYFEFLPVWDFYPDMSAKRLRDAEMDGYFIRKVLSRQGLRRLADREDFMGDQIRKYLSMHPMGNYRPQWYESELRAMGVKANVNEQKIESTKYEILIYHGPVTGQFLTLAGEQIDGDKLADDIDAEVWMVDGIPIKACMNPWRMMDVQMSMIHTFLYDEDDTSPIGFGLPVAIRDSQMGISAATRMMMDNASVVCGPNIEVNTDLMRPDQDVSAITAYKVWYREGTDQSAQWQAVRNIQIDAHIDSLLKVIEFYLKIVDMETFVGPATGGDMSKGPSEPFRTASGAAQLRGDAALPFKDMVRAFDTFTTSIVNSVLIFNQKFNPTLIPDADYNIVARGASSLMMKEVRGMHADNLATTLTPDEKIYYDMRKMAQIRAQSRDMDDILVDDDEAGRREAQQAQTAAQQQQQQDRMFEANLREALANAFKSITQGQKNTAAGDAQSVDSALQLLEVGVNNGLIANNQGQGAGANPGAGAGGQAPEPGDDQLASSADDQIGSGQGSPGDQGQPPNFSGAPGGGAGP